MVPTHQSAVPTQARHGTGAGRTWYRRRQNMIPAQASVQTAVSHRSPSRRPPDTERSLHRSGALYSWHRGARVIAVDRCTHHTGERLTCLRRLARRVRAHASSRRSCAPYAMRDRHLSTASINRAFVVIVTPSNVIVVAGHLKVGVGSLRLLGRDDSLGDPRNTKHNNVVKARNNMPRPSSYGVERYGA